MRVIQIDKIMLAKKGIELLKEAMEESFFNGSDLITFVDICDQLSVSIKEHSLSEIRERLEFIATFKQ